jgi:WD40 repeat protein
MALFDSKIVLTGGLSGEVRFSSLSSGRCLHVIESSGDLVHVNKLVVSENILSVCGNPWIRLHALDALHAAPTTYKGHSNNVTSLNFQEERKWMVSTGEDGQVFIWDLRASGYQTSLKHGSAINCGALHANQGVFVFGDQEGFLNVFDLAANRVVRSSVGNRTGTGVSNLIIDPYGRVTCSHDNRHVSLIGDILSQTEAVQDILSDDSNDQEDFDKSSPRNALVAPPMLLPLISRSMSSSKLPHLQSKVKEAHTTLQGPPCNPLQSIDQESIENLFVTSIKNAPSSGNGTRTLAVCSSSGSLSIWRQNTDDGTLGLSSTTEPLGAGGHIDTWCWDTLFLDETGRYIISAFNNGKCCISDSTRALDPAIAVYPIGMGKPVRTLAIVDKRSFNLITTGTI